VLAAQAGKVITNAAMMSPVNGFGYYVTMQHTSTLRTLYAHGAHRSKHAVGQIVPEGAVIFTSGSTGASTGDHLHFEVHTRNRLGIWTAVDPQPYLDAPPEPFEQKGEDMKMLFNKDNKNDSTRRALIGEMSFQVINATQSTSERKIWGDPVGVTQAEWNTALELVNKRRATIIGQPAAPSATPDEIADELAERLKE
jgi:hypothetical protein